MISIGSVITARISRLEPYGVYLNHDGDQILVMLVDLGWSKKNETYSRLHIGDDMALAVVGYSADKNIYVGSLKPLKPEDNPYLALLNRPRSDVLSGKVEFVHENGVSIVLANGCLATLPFDGPSRKLKVGDEVSITVESVDSDRQIIKLRLAESSAVASHPAANFTDPAHCAS